MMSCSRPQTLTACVLLYWLSDVNHRLPCEMPFRRHDAQTLCSIYSYFGKSAQELQHHYTLCSGSNDLQCHCSLLIFIITCIFPPLTQQLCLWKATAHLRLGFTLINASYVNKVNRNTKRAVFLIISFKRSLLLKYVLTSALSSS